jgi:hypothetical protein
MIMTENTRAELELIQLILEDDCNFNSGDEKLRIINSIINRILK